MKILTLFVALSFLSTINAQITQISEQILYKDISQGDKSYNFYSMSVSTRFFTGTQHLAFKVMTSDYDSDPDIFISKNNTNPTSSSDSRWYCMKTGSDTCVIRRSEISFGDTFYIGVRCINPCTYDLRAYYTSVISLKENTRTQMRLDGSSSNIFEYYVPPDASDGFTTSVRIQVESEDPYSPMDLYLSTDDDLYQIEEKKDAELMENGKVYRLSEEEVGVFCTRCYIYLLLDIQDGGRYYITGRASARNTVLMNNKPQTMVINQRSQQCYQYFIEKQENDLQILVNQYQGEAQIYISNRDMPTGINDGIVRFISDLDYWRGLIITARDRARYNQLTGLYYVCIFAFTDTSMKLTVNEANYNFRYDAIDQMLYTYNIENGGFVYYRYTTPNFARRTTINVQLNAFNLNATIRQEPPRIFYKVCSSQTLSDCYLEMAEAQGKSSTMQEVGVVVRGSSRFGTIYHNPSVCPNVNSCYYMFSTYNALSTQPQKVSFKITQENEDPMDAVLDTAYRNIKQQGSYEYYELLPGSSVGFPYTDQIVIDCRAFSGDADLYVSFTNKFPNMTNYDFASNEIGDQNEQVIIYRTSDFTLNRPIYVSVYAFTQVAYELKFSAVYSPTYNEKLEKAEPLTDSVATYKYFVDEFQEAFFSFMPWWAGSENRTMIFYADVIFNQVFFYLQKNDYPFFYLTEYQDKDDTIALYSQDAKYDRRASYYIRVRPDFALYDLVSKRQYIFNYFAFSQLPDRVYTDLQLNESVMGYCNRTVKYFRHMIMFRNSTYSIQVHPLAGNPMLLVRVSSDPAYPASNSISSFDFRSDVIGKSSEVLNITFEQRFRANFDCDKSGYQLYGGSRSFCNFYIAVECQQQCVYNVSVQVLGRNATTQIQPPKYLTENEYFQGKTSFGQYTYYYFPIHRNRTGDLAILLNKTSPLNQNGDSMILTWMQNDTTLPIERWTYPNISRYHTLSITNQTTQPELIEYCAANFQERCVNSTCALIVGVLGLTRNTTSNFRLMVYTQKNKLYSQQPVSGFIEKAGQYQYFWFVNNATVLNRKAAWEHVIALSPSNPSQDVDLFITAMDGRLPVDNDYDWQSNNLGPDDVFINNTDKFWSFNNWNTSNGIMFVVGVKALSDNASFSLVMTGPQKFRVNFVDLQSAQPITRQFRNISNNSAVLGNINFQVYKWFNWGHRDFRLQVEVSEGNAYMFFNFMSEENYLNNGYLAVPRNIHNSRVSQFLNTTESRIIVVTKNDVAPQGFFCYYCWYYVTVMSNNTRGNTTFRIIVSENSDPGDDMQQLTIGEPQALQLPGTGSVMQRKFILDTKDPFSVSVTLSTGQVMVYVGLYPETPLTRFAWRAQGGIGTTTIRVRTTDPNFKIGTFYYITMQATQGRASISLQVAQSKSIMQLENGIVTKDQFWTFEERVKLYYFYVPRMNFSTTIKIDSLTEDFYPTIYLQQNVLDSVPQDFRTLTYPTIKSNTIKLGENFTELVNQNTLTFNFRGQVTNQFTYYAMTLYSYSYGLTDRRKAEFKISVSIVNDTTNRSNLTNGPLNGQQQETIIPVYQLDDEHQSQFLPNPEPSQETYIERFNEWIQSQYEKFQQSFNYFTSN